MPAAAPAPTPGLDGPPSRGSSPRPAGGGAHRSPDGPSPGPPGADGRTSVWSDSTRVGSSPPFAGHRSPVGWSWRGGGAAQASPMWTRVGSSPIGPTEPAAGIASPEGAAPARSVGGAHSPDGSPAGPPVRPFGGAHSPDGPPVPDGGVAGRGGRLPSAVVRAAGAVPAPAPPSAGSPESHTGANGASLGSDVGAPAFPAAAGRGSGVGSGVNGAGGAVIGAPEAAAPAAAPAARPVAIAPAPAPPGAPGLEGVSLAGVARPAGVAMTGWAAVAPMARASAPPPPATRAAPRATACLGWASSATGRPNAEATSCATSGTRDDPPTRRTRSTCAAVTSAEATARRSEAMLS